MEDFGSVQMVCGEAHLNGPSESHRISQFGRVPLKPEVEVEEHEDLEHYHEETLTPQDQIDNIRTKLLLKERHLKVLRDELEDGTQGSAAAVGALTEETRVLRGRLVDALNWEKDAVQNILRIHREFQLAMDGKDSSVAIPWLEDKVFHYTKRLNLYLYTLESKRKEFEDAEREIVLSLTWGDHELTPREEAAQLNFQRIEIEIDKTRVKRETVSVLLTKYKWMKEYLEKERLRFQPILRGQTNVLDGLRAEVRGMERLLESAKQFRNAAIKNLKETEEESRWNRKLRRRQLRKIRRSVGMALDLNREATQKSQARGVVSQLIRRGLGRSESQELISDKTEELREKHRLIDLYQEKGRRLVEQLRVPNLTYIPSRIEYIDDLTRRLEAEACEKEELRNLLIKQRDQLLLILCHFKYSGMQEHQAFLDRRSKLGSGTNECLKDTTDLERVLNEYGMTISGVRFGVITLIEILDNRKTQASTNGDLFKSFRRAQDRLKKLLEEIDRLKSLFLEPAVRDYSLYVKEVPLPARYMRIKTAEDIDELTDTEDLNEDYKVPTREDIKKWSQRIIYKASMKGGP